jgi:hypothetical protein
MNILSCTCVRECVCVSVCVCVCVCECVCLFCQLICKFAVTKILQYSQLAQDQLHI